MTQIIRGNPSIGMTNQRAAQPTLPLPQYARDPADIINEIAQKLADFELVLERKADADSIRSLVAISDEAILLQAKDIILAGTVTFVDLLNDWNGVNGGSVDPSITRIRGGVIQTGIITSNNWGPSAGSAYDLDNGTITIGGSSAPKLSFDGTDLNVTGTITAGSIITGSVTVDGITMTTIRTNAATGASLNTALTVAGTTILRGTLQPDTSGAIRTGTITWNSSTGALTGGTGVAITQWGIIGASDGSVTFSINAATGAATFKGDITGANGDFGGNVTGSGYLKVTGSLFDVDAFAAINGSPSLSSADGVSGKTASGIGVRGKSSSGIGVSGISTSSIGVVGSSSTSAGGQFYGATGASIYSTSFSGAAIYSSAGNFVMGGATNSGETNLILKEGVSGTRISGQIAMYGQVDSGDAIFGFLSENTVTAGTGAFTGISQIKVYWNNTAYWLPLQAA